VTSRYHDDEHRIVRALRELAELRAELAARKRGCSCRWEPKRGLMPNPECPAHGDEAADLLTLGRVAQVAALQMLTAGQVPR